MTSIRILPATYEDLLRFNGEVRNTQQSLIVEQEGEAIAVVGIYPDRGRYVLFSNIRPDVQKNLPKYKRAVILAYREIMKLIQSKSLPVHSGADPKIDGSDRLLTHMGFQYIDQGVYVWPKPLSH